MRKLLLFCLFAVIVVSGCVSTKTYKAATDESELRRAQLEKVTGDLQEAGKENERLKKELDKYRGEKTALEASQSAKSEEVSTLNNRIADLSARVEGLVKEIDALNKEKDRLTASEAALKGDLENSNREKEFLTREVDRLKLKAGELSSDKEKEIANVRGTYENLVKELKQEIERGDIKITQAVDRLSVNMVEKILFDSGRAEIKKDGLAVLQRVGDILKKVTDKQIRVEGYTDNVQIGARIRNRYPTNWELSTARATNVVRYLQDKAGISPSLLSASGLADNKPVASNDTPEGRAQNRRIEIVLLPLDVDRVLQELKK